MLPVENTVGGKPPDPNGGGCGAGAPGVTAAGTVAPEPAKNQGAESAVPSYANKLNPRKF